MAGNASRFTLFGTPVRGQSIAEDGEAGKGDAGCGALESVA
jgi:hypothetical protein